jgi:hypothetical protein
VAFDGMVPYNIPIEGEIQESTRKITVSSFWDEKGVVLKNVLPRGTTVDSAILKS